MEVLTTDHEIDLAGIGASGLPEGEDLSTVLMDELLRYRKTNVDNLVSVSGKDQLQSLDMDGLTSLNSLD